MSEANSKSHTFTQMMHKAHEGDRESMDWLIREVYDELKLIASNQRRHRHGALQTTALVNEAWIKLEKHGLDLNDQGHFMAVAATAMRQILLDEIKHAMACKRGGDQIHITYQTIPGENVDALVLLQLEDGLNWLASKSERMLNVFQMRYFIGFKESEVAAALNVSERTVRRDWIKARALLSSRL